MMHFASASGRFPRTEARFIPDVMHIRDYRITWDERRFIVEALANGRVLGDKQYPTHAVALVFAKVEAGWHRAKLVDDTPRE